MTAVYGVTLFEFDESDFREDQVWFCDVTHGSPPWKPLYIAHGWCWPGYPTIQTGYESLSVPTSRGWQVRLKDGYPYPSVMLTTDEEAKQRAPIFRERIRPYIENFRALWDEAKLDLKKNYEDLRKKYGLDTYESIADLPDWELYGILEEYLQLHRKQWVVHMELFFVPVYYLFGLFQNMTKSMLGIDAGDPLFSKAMAGFDSSSFRFNEQIWALGKQAIDLGLKGLFLDTEDPEVVLTKLADSPAGKTWLAGFREFLDVYGWRCERMSDWATPSWLEKPALAIPGIKMAIATGGVSTIKDKRELAEKERVEAEKELLEKVPADQRDWFEVLMKCAQNAGYFSEDHTYYTELYTSAMGRWIFKEIGRRFAEAGVIDDTEDVFFLLMNEIYKAIIPMGRVRLQRYVEERKKEWEGYLTVQPQMLYGNPEVMGQVIQKDPVLSAAFAMPNLRPELGADLYGGGSAPGVVEGIARVIMTERDLGELQPGEILVAPGTSAQWTPAFEIAGGIVTDGGGALSHAVIVAREYRLPAVTGTQEATRKIKTGDRVRVDGDLGIVFIVK
ncbi:MAG: PEP-utilizing enzyme [bacterium]